jgi:hypothetical protein
MRKAAFSPVDGPDIRFGSPSTRWSRSFTTAGITPQPFNGGSTCHRRMKNSPGMAYSILHV